MQPCRTLQEVCVCARCSSTNNVCVTVTFIQTKDQSPLCLERLAQAKFTSRLTADADSSKHDAFQHFWNIRPHSLSTHETEVKSTTNMN